MKRAVAGVVNKDIYTAEGVEDRSHHILHRLVVGDIQSEGLGHASGGLDLALHGFDLRGRPAGQH